MEGALNDAFSIVFKFCEVEELLACELCCISFLDRIKHIWQFRTQDIDYKNLIFKNQYMITRDGREELLTPKQQLLGIHRGSPQLIVQGGAFGSAPKAGLLFDLKYAKDSHATHRKPPQFSMYSARVMPLDRGRLGAAASVVNSYGQLEFFGGWDESDELAIDSVVSMTYKEFLVKKVALSVSEEYANQDYEGNILGYRPMSRPTLCRISYGFGLNDDTILYDKYRYKQWTRHEPLPKPLSYSSAVMLKNGDVVVIGGAASPYRGAEVFNKCYIRKQKYTLQVIEDLVAPDNISDRIILKEQQKGHSVRWCATDGASAWPPLQQRLPKDSITVSLDQMDHADSSVIYPPNRMLACRTMSHIEAMEPHTTTFRRFSQGENMIKYKYIDSEFNEDDDDQNDNDSDGNNSHDEESENESYFSDGSVWEDTDIQSYREEDDDGLEAQHGSDNGLEAQHGFDDGLEILELQNLIFDTNMVIHNEQSKRLHKNNPAYGAVSLPGGLQQRNGRGSGISASVEDPDEKSIDYSTHFSASRHGVDSTSHSTKEEEGEETPIWCCGALPPLNIQRCGHASVSTFEDHIITVGGYSGGSNYLKSCEILYHNSSKWQFLPEDMHELRTGSAICLGPSNEIIVAGGSRNGTQVHRTVEQYDLRSGKWIFLAPMNKKRSYTNGCVIKGQYFVVGGGIGNENYSHCDSFDVYDIRHNKWTLYDQKELCHGILSTSDYKDRKENQLGGLWTGDAGQDEPIRRASHQMHYLPPQPLVFL